MVVHIEKDGFFHNLRATLAAIPETSIPTLAVGLVTLVLLLGLERRIPRAPAPLIAVAAGILAVSLLGLQRYGVDMVGEVPRGLPSLTLPDPGLIGALWPGAMGIALVSFTETIAAGRAFASSREPLLVPNRELLERLGLLDASKALLFRFLEAAVHPTAIDENGQKDRVERINRHLQHDGYRLSRTGRISGCPVYTVNAAAIGSPADATISNTLAKFEPEQVHARWTAALDRRSDDPAGAITLARTLLEDVCRWLLDDLDIPAADQDDLPALYRKLSKGLKLAPDDHSEQVFKQILGNCQSIVESLGALRNKLGDAHGGGPKRARPAARHAELAVNLAGSMATFLVATWDTRRKTPTGTAVDD